MILSDFEAFWRGGGLLNKLLPLVIIREICVYMNSFEEKQLISVVILRTLLYLDLHAEMVFTIFLRVTHKQTFSQDFHSMVVHNITFNDYFCKSLPISLFK